MKKKLKKSENIIISDDNKNIEREENNRRNYSKTAMKICIASIIINVALTVFKIIAGILGNSFAMISDAIHSASDVFSTFIVMIGVKIASKKADREHPFGHERFECVAAIILSVMLGVTGAMIGINGIQRIADGSYKEVSLPTALALSAAVVSIIVKEIMFWITNIQAKKINSGSLKADAWHHRSDALSSIGSFIGILFSMLGFPVMDSVAAIVISLMILKAAISVFKESIDKMTDSACDKKTERDIREIIISVDGVLGIDSVKTRKFGDRLYVEAEISLDGSLSLFDAHQIADSVHDEIEYKFPSVKHCVVHTNPKNTQDTISSSEPETSPDIQKE